MSVRTYAARGIVLRSRALGEKDRVLVLLTAEHGKISATARGARNPKGKLAAAAQSFTLARFLIAKGRRLDIVSQAEVENAHIHIAGDLLKTAWASYFCELADIIPEELPEAELFELLEAALNALNLSSAPDEAEGIGRWFEAKYLALLGYAPTIGHCVSCGIKIAVPRAETERAVAFSPALGGTLCGACARDDAARLNVKVQSLRVLHQMERLVAPPDAKLFFNAQSDLRDVLHRSLQAHLGVRLKSRAFLDEVLAAPPEATRTRKSTQ
jgi:DNA repair protein RecO (recombination protein O)